MLGYSINITYKTLIFGLKVTYKAYNNINTLLSILFFAICKYWLKNERTVNINYFIYKDLAKWKYIYEKMAFDLNILTRFTD